MVEGRRIWIDGELVPWREATVHVLSQSLQRGSLVFDVMSCHWLSDGPAIFGLDAHLRRFLNSASLSAMELPLDLEGLVTAVGQTVHANPQAEMVKISAYYPGVSGGLLPSDPVAQIAVAAYAASELEEGSDVHQLRPAELRIAEQRKMPSWVQSPQAKLAAGYLYSSVAKAEAKRKGYDDILLLTSDGNVAESSTQSFFIVDDAILYTAPTDTVLNGITRRVAIELAHDEGWVVREARIPRRQLMHVEEAFLAGTTVHIFPVSRIDELNLPEPLPGLFTGRLQERFKVLLAGADPVFSPRWMQKV